MMTVEWTSCSQAQVLQDSGFRVSVGSELLQCFGFLVVVCYAVLFGIALRLAKFNYTDTILPFWICTLVCIVVPFL